MYPNRQAQPWAVRGWRRRLAGVAAALVTLCLVVTPALADELDLDRAERQRDQAEDRRVQLQRELDVLLSRIEALKVALEEQTAQVERLEERVEDERALADAARARVVDHYRKAYTAGTGSDPLVGLLGGDDLDEVTERTRLLNLLAVDSQRDREAAETASTRGEALSVQLRQASGTLVDRRDELAGQQDEAAQKVAEAQQDVEQLDQDIAAERERQAEEAARRRAEEAAKASERAAQEESGGSSGAADSGAGQVQGGVACPVGDPVSFSDTYGAARSGGRSHMGVDMLAPIGTPIYAYEDGEISRMSNSSLGGITLYLQGDSGNQYYYAHLSGYVAGISAGSRVSAGQHIAHNGDSGNAAGIPHLHWEVRPGGGSNINPYPYAKGACG